MSDYLHFDRFAPGRRKLLGRAALLLATLGAAWLVSQFVINSDWTSLGLAFGALAGLAVAVKILSDWRQGLYIFFGWLFFEDLVRKYLGNNMAVYFGKDFLLILDFFPDGVHQYYFLSGLHRERLSLDVAGRAVPLA